MSATGSEDAVAPAVPEPQFMEAFRIAERLASEGRVQEAITHFDALAASHPKHAPLLNNLGVLWRRAGDPSRGIDYLRRAIAVDAGNGDAHYNLANALAADGPSDRAVDHYRTAIKLRPDFAAAYVNLGRLLAAMGKAKEAKSCLRSGAMRVRSAAIHFQLGLLLSAEGKDAAALACYSVAVGFDSFDSKIRHNRAAAHLKLDRYAEALADADAALEREPNSAETHAIRGQALIGLGRLAEAEAPLRRALEIEPNNLSASLGLARALLLAARFEEGWTAYGARWRRTKTVLPKFDRPQWDGSDPRGKRIVLVTEQGFGDSIQFIRYAAHLAARGASIDIVCEPPLVRLFSRLECVGRVVPKGEALPEHDAYAPLLELPRLVKTGLRTIPAQVPYLSAKSAPARGGPPVIGIVWCGSRDHERDRSRSVPLELFLPLLSNIGARFASLQVGPGAADLARTGIDALVVDLAPRIRDFADTADLIAGIDLVISVDTATAHLAGALGRPVWTLLSYAPDWRWLLGRDDSPWYPTMRLFRQEAPADWGPVFRQVETALARFLEGAQASRTERHADPTAERAA